jgi:hypothetical protein
VSQIRENAKSLSVHTVVPASHGQLRVLRVDDIELEPDTYRDAANCSTCCAAPNQGYVLDLPEFPAPSPTQCNEGQALIRRWPNPLAWCVTSPLKIVDFFAILFLNAGMFESS